MPPLLTLVVVWIWLSFSPLSTSFVLPRRHHTHHHRHIRQHSVLPLDARRKVNHEKGSNHHKNKNIANTHSRPKTTQRWRAFNIQVHPDDLQLDLAQQRHQSHNRTAVQAQFLHPAVVQALRQRLRSRNSRNDASNNTAWAKDMHVKVVRRSLDARPKAKRSDGGTGPRFVYVLDVDIPPNIAADLHLQHQPGQMECLGDVTNNDSVSDGLDDSTASSRHHRHLKVHKTTNAADAPSSTTPKRVLIVGAGPAGLFCALRLVQEPGITPILLERGQPVEVRGRDIGALMHRKVLQPESNYAFGEGGAGTWSDGKLTTRIGRNSDQVRSVLETFVEYGAPPWILLDGAPHLGTDNLVRLLRNMRLDLRKQGGQVYFGTKVTGFVMEDGVIRGVNYEHQQALERNLGMNESSTTPPLESKGSLLADVVVLATGHSARDVYEQLHEAGIELEAKGFAVGFRIEHPQKIINKIQYGNEWGPSVVTGKETTDRENVQFFQAHTHHQWHEGHLPVPSYRLATNKAFDGTTNRGVYSFCMCPGGQIVPASTDPEEVCVNGMSFSRRDSVWANSALVVTVNPDDPILDPYREKYGVLAGIAFQRAMEHKAAVMGGGKLCVPVQRVSDFVTGVTSSSIPSSSYRLGIKSAPCHEIYPSELTMALRHALVEYFDKQMPGYVCEDGLLHAVETRTSSPVRVCRNDITLEAVGIRGLFPAGEGAGFAGGIVSAAVDGMVVADAVIDSLGCHIGITAGRSSEASKSTGNFY